MLNWLAMVAVVSVLVVVVATVVVVILCNLGSATTKGYTKFVARQ